MAPLRGWASCLAPARVRTAGAGFAGEGAPGLPPEEEAQSRALPKGAPGLCLEGRKKGVYA